MLVSRRLMLIPVAFLRVPTPCPGHLPFCDALFLRLIQHGRNASIVLVWLRVRGVYQGSMPRTVVIRARLG